MSTDDLVGPGPQARYLAALHEGRFELQQCAACQKVCFPPRMACPHCGATELDWQVQDGDGTIYSTTTVRAVGEGEAPYDVSLADLDVGIRLMAAVDGVSADTVRIGQRIRTRVQGSGENARLIFECVATEIEQ